MKTINNDQQSLFYSAQKNDLFNEDSIQFHEKSIIKNLLDDEEPKSQRYQNELSAETNSNAFVQKNNRKFKMSIQSPPVYQSNPIE